MSLTFLFSSAVLLCLLLGHVLDHLHYLLSWRSQDACPDMAQHLVAQYEWTDPIHLGVIL